MIFILGGKGFVGSAYARICRARGLEHIVIDRDNYSAHAGSRCSVFVYAGGNSKKYLSRESPLSDFDASVRSVRSSLVDFRFDTYVLVSSADVYPEASSPATTVESMPLDVASMTPYGFHKYVAELCVRHCAAEWLIARCGGFVGPRIRKNPIFDILTGGPLWLSPESELQYIHTDQAASAVLDVLDGGVRNEVINLCGRGVVRLAEVLEWTGNQVPVRPNSPRIRCEMSLARVSALVNLPETRSVVRDFVNGKEGESVRAPAAVGPGVSPESELTN